MRITMSIREKNYCRFSQNGDIYAKMGKPCLAPPRPWDTGRDFGGANVLYGGMIFYNLKKNLHILFAHELYYYS